MTQSRRMPLWITSPGKSGRCCGGWRHQGHRTFFLIWQQGRPSCSLLLRKHGPRGHRRRCCRWRNIERQPDVPACWPIFAGKFAVGFQVEVALQLVCERKNVTDLRADANHSRLEAANAIARAAIAADLLIEVTHEADLPLLGQELRGAPVEVHVHPVLVLGGRVFEVVCESEYRRKFVPGLLVEIGVPAPGIERPVPDSYVGKTS